MYKIYFNNNFILLLEQGAVVPSGVELCEFDVTKMLQIVENNKNVATLCDNLEENFAVFTTFFDVHPAGGGLVRNQNDEYLMIFRNNCWDLPKGHLEKGETMEQCAVREVQEECGLKQLEIESFLCETMHIYPLKKRLVLKKTTWYMMNSDINELLIPQTEEGITQIKWQTREELRQISTKTYQSIADVLAYLN